MRFRIKETGAIVETRDAEGKFYIPNTNGFVFYTGDFAALGLTLEEIKPESGEKIIGIKSEVDAFMKRMAEALIKVDYPKPEVKKLLAYVNQKNDEVVFTTGFGGFRCRSFPENFTREPSFDIEYPERK